MLDAAVDEALERLGGGPAVELAALRARAAGAGAARAAPRWPSGAGGRARCRAPTPTRSSRSATRAAAALDLGGGLRAVAEYGTCCASRAARAAEPPAPVALPVPGSVRFGDWEVEAPLGGAAR